jgi:hypothetical protein
MPSNQKHKRKSCSEKDASRVMGAVPTPDCGSEKTGFRPGNSRYVVFSYGKLVLVLIVVAEARVTE